MFGCLIWKYGIVLHCVCCCWFTFIRALISQIFCNVKRQYTILDQIVESTTYLWFSCMQLWCNKQYAKSDDMKHYMSDYQEYLGWFLSLVRDLTLFLSKNFGRKTNQCLSITRHGGLQGKPCMYLVTDGQIHLLFSGFSLPLARTSPDGPPLQANVT